MFCRHFDQFESHRHNYLRDAAFHCHEGEFLRHQVVEALAPGMNKWEKTRSSTDNLFVM